MSTFDIQSVGRVAAILELFGPHREGVSSSEAADLIGLNRTTTYRYLNSLVVAGVLEVRPDRTYVPGPTLVQLGTFALGRRDVVRLAQEPMLHLAQETAITSVLSLWGSSSPVVAHVEEPPEQRVVVTVKVGMHLATDAAQSRAFYAFRRDDSRVQAAIRAIDQDRVFPDIEQIRDLGFSTQISSRGIAVVAAPIWDTTGMVASLALLSTRDVLDLSADGSHTTALLKTARTISRSMGADRLDHAIPG